jgi:putative cell wall-binding protein
MDFSRWSRKARCGAAAHGTRSHAIPRRLATACGIAVLVGASFSVPTVAASRAQPQTNFGSATVTTETLAGADQYAAAVALSQSISPDGHVPVVYLASGVAPGGALAAGPAAAHDGGIVLLTDPSSLPSAVADELVRLGPARVEVVGGAAAVSDSVVAQVVALLDPATVVERAVGEDAYGTAAALSAQSFRANTGATFHAITPGRVLDSRIPRGATRFHSRVKQSFAVGGLFGVPLDAVAVTGNVTIVGQTQSGYVTVAPLLASGVAPSTSTINFPMGDTRANGLTVALGVAGRLDAIYWSANTSGLVNIVFDVTGYFANDPTGATFIATTPGRVLDSRLSLGGGLFHSRVKQTVQVGGLFGVPLDAVGVTGNVTITGQTQGGYVAVAPALVSGTQPSTSTINFPVRDTRANGVSVALAAGGRLDFMYFAGSTASTTQIVFDVTGFFADDPAGATYHPVAPRRVLDSRLPRGAGLFHARAKQTVAIGGLYGVPAEAVGVTGNVTITGQTEGGYVAVAPALVSGTQPSTSTINFPVRDVRANGVSVALAADGRLDFMYWASNLGSTVHIVFDVTGYFAIDPVEGQNHTSATVVVASADSPPDAIVAGSAAAALGVPFLLVGAGTLPAATATELSRLRPDHVVIVGSTTSVSALVLSQITALAPNVERLAGTDAYSTAQSVATKFFPHAATIIAARSASFADELAAVPLSVARAAPILYLQDTDLLPVATRDILISLRPTHIVLLGSVPSLNQAELVGFADGRLTKPTDLTAYPSYDSGYHDPGELYTVIKAEEIAYPTLVHVFSIGKSYQGRDIWAAKVSSDVTLELGKPETLVDALHHADEHLTVEQALYLLETLTSQYETDPVVNRLVNERVTWIVFAVNPDGWTYDLSGGQYQHWRKNRQPVKTSYDIGTDINRNYGYKWGCCGGSSSGAWAWNYRGTAPFSTPEAQAIRNFVNSRVINGVQMIKTQVSLHTAGGLILYPYCYTKTALPSDMTADDHAVFVKMAQTMAGLDGYKYEQSSYLYVTDGDEIDWLYHTFGVFAFTVELYPTTASTEAAAEAGPQLASGVPSLVGVDPAVVYPPFSVVAAQVARNRGMLLYLIDSAACPYSEIGKAAQYCGV